MKQENTFKKTMIRCSCGKDYYWNGEYYYCLDCGNKI